MNQQQDIDTVCRIAEERMPNTEYHNRNHSIRVAEEVAILSSDKDEETKNVLRVAAYFHDTGHASNGTEGHEKRSCRFARGVLTGHGFEEEFINRVEDAIMSTVFLEEPKSEEGQYLADADVWNFGAEWTTFVDRTEAVWQEFAPEVDKDEWFAFRAFVMEEHEYYTDGGTERYAEQKQKNIEKCREEYGYRTTKPW